MSRQIDYYFAPNSPWTYLGHERFVEIARERGAHINVLPVDLGRVFPVSGGLPLAKRAPQRQAYRLAELARFSLHLKLPLNLQPKYFPVAADNAARTIIAVQMHDSQDDLMRFCIAVFRAVWVQDRDIADEAVLATLLREQGLDEARVAQSHDAAVQQRYDTNTARAIEVGIFGAPSYVIDGELFWGQDRLDFVERKLLGA